MAFKFMLHLKMVVFKMRILMPSVNQIWSILLVDGFCGLKKITSHKRKVTLLVVGGLL